MTWTLAVSRARPDVTLARPSFSRALPLSQAMIFGSAISNLIYNWNKRHPLDPNRRIIDFDIALMMEPMTLGGTVVGVFLNVFLPPWVIVVSLTTLLSLTSVRMLRKGLAKHREESQRAPTSLLGDEMEEATQLLGDGGGMGDGRGDGRGGGGGLLGDEGESVPEPSARNVWDDGRTTFGAGRGVIIKAVHEEIEDPMARKNGGDGHADAGDGGENGMGKDGELGGKHGDDDGSGPLLLDDDGPNESVGLRRIREEERVVPTRKLIVLSVAWCGILFLSLLKGGHGAPSLVHIKGCSAAYWGVVAMTFPFLIIITVVVARWLRRQHRRKLELNYTYLPGDVRWTKRNTILYPGMCMIAGILAGLLGIGGGMVKGPLMLEMGVLPQTTAATASFMILFTSSCTTLQFLILGMLPSDFAIWYGFVGFVSSYVGQVIMGHFVSKYGRVSYIILSIAVVIAGSTLLMGITGTQEVVADIRSGKHLGFSPIC